MTTVELKKELIKKVVTPFFKNNGFLKSGVKFYRNLSFFQIEADIQSQRYYKENGVENFRIHYHISCERFTSFYGRKEYFGGGTIQRESSWITIDDNTELEILSKWIQEELEKISELIDIYSNPEKVIDRLRETQDITYAFLLKEFGKDKELTAWKTLRENERIKYSSRVKEIEEEKQNLENRSDSLDKTVRLEGVAMQLRDLTNKIEKIDKEMRMVE